jgi:uncharacterized protein YjiS (DUF1127 family)
MENPMSVFAVNSQSHTLVSSAIEAFRAVVNKVAAIGIAWKNRREINQLVEFDTAMLRDIGLTAMDIDGALSEPLWRDPSARLASAQCERRMAIKAAKRENFTGLHA